MPASSRMDRVVTMRRRELLLGLGGALAARGAHAQKPVRPFAGRAEERVVPLIGFLGATSRGALGSEFDGFIRGLEETGFADGRNAAIEYRWAEGHYDRLPAMAVELVDRRPNVIVAATLPSALAAKAATTTIPIVFFSGGDPVEQGLVASFSRPGGNLTGSCVFLNDLGPKRLELLHELVPEARVIGFLVNLANPNADYQSKGMLTAVGVGGRRLVTLGVRTAADIDAAFASLAEQHGDRMVIGADPFFGGQLHQIAGLAQRYRIPTVSSSRNFVEAGGLIGYGNDVADSYRQVGVYTGRILQGAKPADLPIERATKFQLFINLKTAKALGLAVPQAILARADEVIE